MSSFTRNRTADWLEPIAVKVPEAARLLSVSRGTMYNLIATGQIKARKTGRVILVNYRSLTDYMERSC